MTRTIAIVGAGFAGTATAVQILRKCRTPGTRVILVERERPFGRGLAYCSWDENQVLNVPAGNMSAIAEEPGHFAEYCKWVDPALHAGSFVSRRIYGDYLEDTLRDSQLAAVAKLEMVRGEATALRRFAAGGFELELAGAGSMGADSVVLAFGHFLPADPLPGLRSQLGDRYLANPWDIAALDRCDRSRAIVLIGSGNTAIDVLLRLASRGDSTRLLMLSRHGLLSACHRPVPHAPDYAQFPSYLNEAFERGTLRALVGAVRAHAERREQAGGDWRDVLNEMRPHIPHIWGRLPEVERRRFLQHVVPFWDVHRHRVAPSVAVRLQRMLATGEVQYFAARLLSCEGDTEGARLRIRERRSGVERTIAAGTVVNCSGPRYDIDRIDEPLIAQLRSEGIVRADPLHLGLDIGDGYEVVDGHGRCVPHLHYIGPMLKAKFWEAIAVPELRGHAQRLAEHLLSATPKLIAADRSPSLKTVSATVASSVG